MYATLVVLLIVLSFSGGFAAGAGWAAINRSDDDDPSVTPRSRIDREIDWFLSH